MCATRSFSQTHIVYLNCIYAEKYTVWWKLRIEKERERDISVEKERQPPVSPPECDSVVQLTRAWRLHQEITTDLCVLYCTRRCDFSTITVVNRYYSWQVHGISIHYIYIHLHKRICLVCRVYVYTLLILPTAVYYILCGTRFNAFTVEATVLKIVRFLTPFRSVLYTRITLQSD